jgi:2,5-diketo-D-gluconate reductase B
VVAALPALGFGTYPLTGRECEDAVRDALEIGYRHIDTARNYRNEAAVGRALAASGVPREDVWLTTKIAHDEPRAMRAAAERSLHELGTDYVDLLLLHWPNPELSLVDALRALTGLAGIRHLGVSNVPAGMLRRTVREIPVFANQIEYHPFLGQDRLLDAAAEGGVAVIAYAPLANGLVASDPTLQAVAAAHGRTAGQVALRWLLDQPRVSAIPKASGHDRRVENFQALDFKLRPEDCARIAALPNDRRLFDPPGAPDWDD